MPFISLTRLRIRSVRFLPAFALHAIRTRSQVAAAPGFLSGALLPDRIFTFWTMTVWDDEASMRAYMISGAHKQAMPYLMHWCDEASVAHWTQPTSTVPTWTEADRRMREEGRSSKVNHPSPDHVNGAHANLRYRTPRTSGSAPIPPRAPSA